MTLLDKILDLNEEIADALPDPLRSTTAPHHTICSVKSDGTLALLAPLNLNYGDVIALRDYLNKLLAEEVPRGEEA